MENKSKFYRRVMRPIKHFFQRRIRGWDDSDTQDLSLAVAEFILPRLKRFKEIITDIYPCFPSGTITYEQWKTDLDIIISAFELIILDEYTTTLPYESTLVSKKINEGLDLFRKHFFNLWW